MKKFKHPLFKKGTIVQLKREGTDKGVNYKILSIGAKQAKIIPDSVLTYRYQQTLYLYSKEDCERFNNGVFGGTYNDEWEQIFTACTVDGWDV